MRHFGLPIMKTKTSTTPLDTERVRDNQRRSRQRKKEYIHILEARLAEYEKNGVQVNINPTTHVAAHLIHPTIIGECRTSKEGESSGRGECQAKGVVE